MIQFNTVAELIQLAEEKELQVHDIVLAREMHDTQRPKQAIVCDMQRNWAVMQAAIERGIENEEHSVSGLTGGDAEKIYEHRTDGYLGAAALSAAALLKVFQNGEGPLHRLDGFCGCHIFSFLVRSVS